MGDNVKEWLLDEYKLAKKHYSNPDDIYTANGFVPAEDKTYRDEKGYVGEKDSLGKLPYRIMGIKPNGDELKVMRYNKSYYTFYITKEPNPDSEKVKLAQMGILEHH